MVRTSRQLATKFESPQADCDSICYSELFFRCYFNIKTVKSEMRSTIQKSSLSSHASKSMIAHNAINRVQGHISCRPGTLANSPLSLCVKNRAIRSTNAGDRNQYVMVQSKGYGSAGQNLNGEAKIKVIGCGGGGGNAINRMITSGLNGVEFWAVNTDSQALASHTSLNKVQIGTELTRGLGCGGNPLLGQQAALESEEALRKMLQGADLVFITAGEAQNL